MFDSPLSLLFLFLCVSLGFFFGRRSPSPPPLPPPSKEFILSPNTNDDEDDEKPLGSPPSLLLSGSNISIVSPPSLSRPPLPKIRIERRDSPIDGLSESEDDGEEGDESKEIPHNSTVSSLSPLSPSSAFSSLMSSGVSASSPPVDSEFSARPTVVIVAKNLPVRTKRISTNPNKWEAEWDDTRNFLSGIRCLRQHVDVRWVGCPNTGDDEITRDEQDDYEEFLTQHDCTPVFLPQKLKVRFFEGFCANLLWPILHYVLPVSSSSSGDQWDDLWQSYISANSLFASVVIRTVESPTDFIWIQNYHFLLMPSLLRAKLQRAKIGLFLHTPFPSSDVFRTLPSRGTLLSSMMAADLIGFHTFDYARHFLSAIKRVMDLDFESLPGGSLGIKFNGRFISITISHLGIDSFLFRSLSSDPKVSESSRDFRLKFSGRSVILGVDTADKVKGPLLKVTALQHFTQKFPQWRDKVVFVQILLPGSGNSEDFRIALRGEFENLRKICGDSAVHLVEAKEKIPLAQLVSLYCAADVCLVSTCWDGLNLIPYEFTASQPPNGIPGSLIISESMGCARSLNGVFRVNPWSPEEIAENLHAALQLSDAERIAAHQKRVNYVMNHTVDRWAFGFIESLERAAKFSSDMNFVAVGWGSNVKLMGLRADFAHLDEDRVTTAYRKSNRRILLLDYDGTLTPAEKTVAGSKLIGPTAHLKRLLKTLCDDEENVVFIMTGRTRSVLTEWFVDLPQLGLAAEKGLFIKWPQRIASACRVDRFQPPTGPSDSSPLAPRGSLSLSLSNVRPTGVGYSISVGDSSRISLSPSGSDSPTLSSSVSPPCALQEESTIGVVDSDWEYLFPVDRADWKPLAFDLIRQYTEQTDGSWIEDKEYAIVWHYENCDPEYGKMQAAELQKYLISLLHNPQVDVVKYDWNRILEVKPHGVSKGFAATAILETLLNKSKMTKSNSQKSLNEMSSIPLAESREREGGQRERGAVTSASLIPFVLCCGDDRSDESMFIAVQSEEWAEGKLKRAPPKSLQRLPSTAKGQRSQQRDSLSQSPPAPQSPAPSSLSASDNEGDVNVSPPMSSRVRRQTVNSFTVCVGMKPSNANFYLNDDDEVLRILSALSVCSMRLMDSKREDNERLKNSMKQNFTAGGNSQMNALSKSKGKLLNSNSSPSASLPHSESEGEDDGHGDVDGDGESSLPIPSAFRSLRGFGKGKKMIAVQADDSDADDADIDDQLED